MGSGLREGRMGGRKREGGIVCPSVINNDIVMILKGTISC